MFETHHRIQQKLPDKSTLPGFIAVSSEDSEYAEKVLLAGVSKFFHPFGNNIQYFSIDFFRIALLLPEVTTDLRRCALFNNSQYFSFIQGDFLDSRVLDSSNCAEFVAQAFSDNADSLKSLKGTYTGFVYDKTSRKINLFGDATGIEKAYYYSSNSVFVTSNNIFSIISNSTIPFDLNRIALTETILYQFPTRNATIESSTKVLLPDEVVIASHANTQVRKIKTLIFSRAIVKHKSNHVEHALSSQFECIRKYVKKPIALYLSMGKDSRILLALLREHSIPYELYNFSYGSTGPIDAPNVARISAAAGKDLHIIDNYDSDLPTDIRLAMEATFHTEWMSVANLAQSNGLNCFMLGTAADAWSGKLESFRNPSVHDKNSLFKTLLTGITKGSFFRFEDSFPWLNSSKEVTSHFLEYYTEIDEEFLCDVEQRWMLDYRCFRNTYPILNRCRFFGSAIHPFMDPDVLNAYFTLPINKIRSQQLHVNLACKDPALSGIPSIAGKIPLKYEKHLRKLILLAVRRRAERNLTKSAAIRKSHEKTYTLISGLLQELAGSTQVTTYNKRLHQRIENTDLFLKHGVEALRNTEGKNAHPPFIKL